LFVKRTLLAMIAGLITMLAVTEMQVAFADSDEGGTEGPPTETLTLDPGDTFVGWVADPIAVEDIFEAIPAANLIYTWLADSRSYRYAGRDIDGTLETIQPGMAVKIRIDGRRSVNWNRALTPAKGMVTLYSGENWVAWNGRDKWPLEEVARGIGTALTSIEVRGIAYQPNSDVSDTVGPLIGDIEIRRGDALRVTVNRDLRWLQPTGILPNIVWVGDIDQNLRQEIVADFRRTLDFFAESFAVETDFSDTFVLVWKGVDAAVQYQESGAEPRFPGTPEGLRAQLTNYSLAGAESWVFYIPACAWQPPCSSHGSQDGGVPTLTHEWFHYLQHQLSARHRLLLPLWMVEGAAVWSEWQLPAELRTSPSEADRRWRLDSVARTSVTLKSAEERNTPWEYRLGSIAAERLAERSGADTHIEFIRRLYPQVLDTNRRWLLTPTWQDAFREAFGITPANFHKDFEAWRVTLPAPRQRYDYGPNDRTLSGVLRLSDGSPASGFRLDATEHVGEHRSNLPRSVIVDEQGAFSIDLAPNTTQRISFTRDDCTLWLGEDGLTATRPQVGQYRDLNSRQLPTLDLRLPEGACENRLRVDVLRLRSDDRRLQVLLTTEDRRTWIQMQPGTIGLHTGFAPAPGPYLVRIILGGCDLWWSKDGLVALQQDAALFELSKQPMLLQSRLPYDLCIRKIGGRIVTEGGSRVRGVAVVAWSAGQHGFAHSGTSGEFSITVPDSGQFYLSFGTEVDSCRIYYGASGASSGARATPVTVQGEDVRGIEFVVPVDPSSLCR